VRKLRPAQDYVEALTRLERKPGLAAIFGSLFNAVFMDAIDGDLERLGRINHTLGLIPTNTARQDVGLRPIEAFMISPSEDLGEMARPHLKHFPAKLRYFLRRLGADQPESADRDDVTCE
jgi:NTE family protein